ncbi:MAG TPA: MmgE/PrpD family protein [Dehalococcoidia bacterium]|nr:MmgE/PrpD family protein [Dehalococcoidia bacterium]
MTERLAQFVVETTYNDLPAEAIEQGKRALLDTIGVSLAGVRDDTGKIIVETIAEIGGKPVAGVFGSSLKLDPASAALINGTLGHALDYDDVNGSMRGHPSVPIAPAALAVGESVGASGQDILLAFILGVEVECKVGRGINIGSHYNAGWHATATLGVLGAAAAAGKLLELSDDQMVMALGIAASEASGLRQNFGTMTKPFHAGNAARGGVLAALLARNGFTADAAILEAKIGFGQIFSAGGQFDIERTVASLGNPYDIVKPGISVKKYPCCFATHRALDAMAKIRREYEIQPSDVELIQVTVASGGLTPLIHSRPKTGLEGKFSMEYCLAAGLLDDQIRLATFSDEAVARPEAQALIPKVDVREDPDATAGPDGGFAEVKVRLTGGQEYDRRVDNPRGDPADPLSWDELVDKYQDCAALILDHPATDQSVRLLESLENLPDITQLMDIVCLTAPSHVQA